VSSHHTLSKPALGWAALSRSALATAEAQLVDHVEGVRDEVGVLALHFGYANRFFPGSSVQQTRLRYALFVPWQIVTLLRDGGVRRGQAQAALREAEMALALRLPNRDGAGTIGRYTARNGKPVSIPPSMAYWTALGSWGVLNVPPNTPAPTRAEVYRHWTRWVEGRPARSTLTDDEHRRLHQPPRLFHRDLPEPAPDFRAGGLLDFTLRPDERRFLRNRLRDVQREHDLKPSFLSTLVREGATPSAKQAMWARPLRALADRADRAALERARDAASLAAATRAFYLACVEGLKDERDRRDDSTRHRDHLASVVRVHGKRAQRLRLDKLALDGVHIGGLGGVLTHVQRWLKAGGTDPLDEPLRASMATWEEQRKGGRARLPLTGRARDARAAWRGDKAGRAGPIGYRWSLIRVLLDDLQGSA